MKKKLILLLSSSLLSLGAIAINSPKKQIAYAKEPELVSNTSSDWEICQGTGITATNIDNGIEIGKLSGVHVGMYYKEKLPLDGMSFTFNNVIGAECPAVGFYFSKSTIHNWSKNTFYLWHDPWKANQARLSITNSHDYNGTPTCYTSPSFTTAGFDIAGSMVMNNNLSKEGLINDGFKIHFAKVSGTAWEVKIYQLYPHSLWEANSNYTKDDTGIYCVTYLKDSDVRTYLDDDGKAYLHVAGTSSEAVSNTLQLTDLSCVFEENPVVNKADLQAAIDEIKDSDIESFFLKPDFIEYFKNLKTEANEFLKTAPESAPKSNYYTVNNFLKKWGDRFTTYGYLGSNNSIVEGLPLTNHVGVNGAQRIDDEMIQLSLTGGYGNRLSFNQTFDATNIVLHLNLGMLPVYATLPITINPNNVPDGYINGSDQLYHIELYKTAEDTYMVVFGNTTSHNLSFEDYGTERTSNGYVGKFIKSFSGDISISIRTDFDAKKTVFNVNNGQINYELPDNSVLNKGGRIRKAIDAKLSLGLMSPTSLCDLMVLKTFSPDDENKTFKKGDSTDVKLFFDLNGENMTSFKLDDVSVPLDAYSFKKSGNISLFAKYLNTLTVGKHTVVLTTENQSVTWTLRVNANTNPDYPWTRKGAVYVKQENIVDIVYPIDLFGANPSDLTIKLDDEELSSESYEFKDYNTKFVIKGSAISTWSIGEHIVAISLVGIEGSCNCYITIL